MLTPAIAALITRLFFYENKFKDANLRFGRLSDYGKYWLFLRRLSEQFAAAGQDMESSLPPGFMPQLMLMIYFLGGLTLFNILPGMITGFGEEFGHRGVMFPALYDIKHRAGIFVGGLIYYAWHWPVALIAPQTAEMSVRESILNRQFARPYWILVSRSRSAHKHFVITSPHNYPNLEQFDGRSMNCWGISIYGSLCMR